MRAKKRASPTYDRFYYLHYLASPESGGDYSRSEHWLRFFGHMADRIVADIGPRSALDAGCAMGILVESLRDRNVDSYGIDVSDYALEHVRDDVRPFCSKASVTDPFSRRYDLITCIETLEHLTPHDAEVAVANICAHTDDVIFSSTPGHFREPTHLNVKPLEYWAELFARHGLHRDFEYDVSTYIAPWALRLRRQQLSPSALTRHYERALWPLRQENLDLRQAALERQAELASATERVEVAEANVRAVRQGFAETQASVGWHVARVINRAVDSLLPPGSRRRSAARRLRLRAAPPPPS